MIDLLLLRQKISIQVTAWVFMFKNGFKVKLVLDLFDDGVRSSNPHPSYLDIIARLTSPFSYFRLLHIYSVVNLSAKLRILIQVGNMRFTQIKFVVGWIYL